MQLMLQASWSRSGWMPVRISQRIRGRLNRWRQAAWAGRAVRCTPRGGSCLQWSATRSAMQRPSRIETFFETRLRSSCKAVKFGLADQ